MYNMYIKILPVPYWQMIHFWVDQPLAVDFGAWCECLDVVSLNAQLNLKWPLKKHFFSNGLYVRAYFVGSTFWLAIWLSDVTEYIIFWRHFVLDKSHRLIGLQKHLFQHIWSCMTRQWYIHHYYISSGIHTRWNLTSNKIFVLLAVITLQSRFLSGIPLVPKSDVKQYFTTTTAYTRKCRKNWRSPVL